jgi:hypothetical protein
MQESKTEIINVRLTKKERINLNEIAKRDKKTVSDLIREGINNYKKTIDAV